MREIVLDTETTGLDPNKGDRLVEIGCVEIVNRFLTGRVFHRYLNPERPMSPDAFAVHGLSDAFLADKPKFREVADEFVQFIGDDPLVIHNASFDIGFLNHELKRLGKPTIASSRVVDTLMLARRRHPGQQNSLDALCQRYGIDNSRRTKHGALLDSEILAEVYAELTGGRQSSLGLAPDLSAPVTGSDPVVREAGIARQFTRHKSRITETERQQHQAFIAQMGAKAVWNEYRSDTAEGDRPAVAKA
jgi:DNA polymerase-3 subunit epsilon